MKFARQLEEYQLPEFKDHYLPYDFLKRRLFDISSSRCLAVVDELTRLPARHELGRSFSSPLSAPPMSPSAAARRISRLSAVEAGPEDRERALMLWWAFVESQAARIGACVDHRLRQLVAQAGELAAMQCERGSYVELELLQGLQRVSEGLARLQSFAELNHAAFYKIAKKHDKVQSSTRGLTEHLPRLIRDSGLRDNKRFQSLETQLRGLMLQCSQCQGLEASPRVALLVASLSPGHASRTGVDQTYIQGERMRFFFLGCCSALLLTIITLISLPAVQPETFDPAYFLASFSVFRVVWSVLLILWCMGTVARVCDDNFINHMFILSVDPRCRATANYLFGKAAFLTSLWILFLGMYVLDYKWMLLPTVAQTRESVYRSGWHFVLYPLVLLSLTLLMVVYPSKVCRMRYRAQLLGCIGRTCLAPFYAVSFADNLVGDVMTSLAKPLEDIPSAICYLASHHPQQPQDVRAFIKDGDVCPRWVHVGLMPFIAGLPFLFRLLQCARRYRDTKEIKHLLNLGKYLTSLLVLVVTRTWKEGITVVIVSVVATVYAASWDIRMDWGLDCSFLCSICARRRGGAVAADPAGSGLDGARELSADLLPAGSIEIRLQEEGGLAGRAQEAAPPPQAAAPPPQAAALPVADGSQMSKRHFSPRTYFVASCLDIVLRMTWVLSLIPISLLSNDIVQRAVLQTSIATLEILRRSMWTVLRIENEQVNNASGYRALHWVPLQLQSITPQKCCQAEEKCCPAEEGFQPSTGGSS